MLQFRHHQLVRAANRLFSTKFIAPNQETNVRPENVASPLINPRIQAAINEQINAELVAGYTYLSISYYFAKSSVGLMGFSKFYNTMSNEEVGHAGLLAHYLLKRNGSVDLGPIKKPASCSWSNISTALNETLRLENCVSESLTSLYRMAEKQNDPVTADFIVSEFLNEQIESIRSVNLLIARWRTLEKAPNGIYLLDKELEKKHKS